MSLSKFVSLAALDFGIQWAMWGISSLLRTEKFYDLTGSSTFILITLINYFKNSTGHLRTKVQSSAVIIWAVRLGYFLFSRILRDGHDRRFNNARDNPLLFFIFWTMQGVWVFITLLPTMMVVMERQQAKLNTLDYLGWILWVIGFTTEMIADHQKGQFRSVPTNRDKFISTGLWSLSRHPNYLGEILLWFGLFISASSNFTNWWQYLSILSPTAVYLLITKVSGIPLLEQHGLKKWGHLPEYQTYLNNTPELFPLLSSLFSLGL